MCLFLGGGFGGRKESGQLRFGCIDRPWKIPTPNRHYEVRNRQTSLPVDKHTCSIKGYHFSTDERGRRYEEHDTKRKIDVCRTKSHRGKEKYVRNGIKRQKK